MCNIARMTKGTSRVDIYMKFLLYKIKPILEILDKESTSWTHFEINNNQRLWKCLLSINDKYTKELFFICISNYLLVT